MSAAELVAEVQPVPKPAPAVALRVAYKRFTLWRNAGVFSWHLDDAGTWTPAQYRAFVEAGDERLRHTAVNLVVADGGV
jgi:hypothetical protein